MHPSAAAAPAAAAAAVSSPQSLLDQINSLLSLLLLSSLTVRFTGRWQALRLKLTTLRSSLSSLSSSPHWSDNPLLQTLLPDLLSTLQRLKSLHDHCAGPSFNGGKLHMQSDLDMASTSLSNHLDDLDLLLRSGVLHQSNAIVLSQPGPGSGKDDVLLFVKDLFTRLQIGGIEFKKKALESLLQLLADDEKAASLVAKEGNVAYLIQLLDPNNSSSVREQALAAVSILASANDESRKSVFEGGGLGPLLRIIETGSSAFKEKAAIAVEAITADLENAWAISAYSGVSVLVEACRSSSPVAQSHAVGAIRNVACVEDIKVALAEEGAVPVLVQLLSSSSTAAIEKSAGSIAILAESGEYFRTLILQERGLQKLMRLIQDLSSPDALESVLRAISSLLASEAVARILSSSTAFIRRANQTWKHQITADFGVVVVKFVSKRWQQAGDLELHELAVEADGVAEAGRFAGLGDAGAGGAADRPVEPEGAGEGREVRDEAGPDAGSGERAGAEEATGGCGGGDRRDSQPGMPEEARGRRCPPAHAAAGGDGDRRSEAGVAEARRKQTEDDVQPDVEGISELPQLTTPPNERD
ncbi:hypothetical protein BT93_H2068 [Corymbia citriodora subsp. variegata]|nr:hypothetical protein BT93_H2068 [Corymbia citriodora subsp. variegata]